MSGVSDQVAAVRRGAGLVQHAERGVIEVSGTDRVRWLDGMLSADVAALAPGPSRSGCYALQLTRQGRILADHHVLLRDASLWLETRRDHIDDLITALDRYIIADDVALRDVSPELERLGLEGPASREVLSRALGRELELSPECVTDVELAEVRLAVARFGWSGEDAYQLFAPAGSGTALGQCIDAAARSVLDEGAWAPAVSDGAFEILRIEAGTPWLGAELAEDVLPDEVKLARAVSTTKGCYTGQEVVARMRSQGQASHLLVGLRFEAAPASVGSRLSSGGRRAGEVSSICVSPRCGPIGLGFVRRAHAEPGACLEVAGGGKAIVEVLPFPDAAVGGSELG